MSDHNAQSEHHTPTTKGMRDQRFTIFWWAQAIGALGQSIFLLVLYWVVQADTGSTAMTGMVGTLMFLPALLSPWAGVIADRVDRVRIMLISDGARILPIGILVVGIGIGLEPHWYYLVLAGVVLSFATQFYGPARFAVLPELVPESYLTKANGSIFTAEQVSALIGSLAAGTLLTILGVGPSLVGVFALLAASFGALVIMSRLVRGANTRAKTDHINWKDGFRTVFGRTVLRTLILCAGLLYLAFTPLVVLMPAWAQDYLGTTAQGYGAIEAALSIGMAIGGLSAGVISQRVGNYGVLSAGAIFTGLTLAMVSFQSTLLGTLAVFVVVGAPLAACQVTLTAMLQQMTGEEIRGRVFAVLNVVTTLSMPLGMLVSGIAAQSFGVKAVWWVSAVLFCLVGLGLGVQHRIQGNVVKEVN